jgi:hypothetical protein
MKNISTKVKEKEKAGVVGRVRITTYKAGTKEMIRQTPWSRNIIVSTDGYGRNIVARRLGGDNTYSLNVTHGEIGTGTAPVSVSDTALATPTLRTVMTAPVISNNAVSLQFFFADGLLADDTYYEFGSFIDGSSGIGTGRMFNHVLFGTPYVKAGGEDTTVEVDITIN